MGKMAIAVANTILKAMINNACDRHDVIGELELFNTNTNQRTHHKRLSLKIICPQLGGKVVVARHAGNSRSRGVVAVSVVFG